MTTRRTADPAGGLPARWSGTCDICGEVFGKNAPIVKKRGRPCHVACYTAEKS